MTTKYQKPKHNETQKNQAAFARLAWDWSDHHLLDSQLDPARSTHKLGLFPDVAGLLSAIDGLVFWRTGTSLLTRSPRKYWAYSLSLAPVWWIFELLNIRTQNWTYSALTLYPLRIYLLDNFEFHDCDPGCFWKRGILRQF